MQDKHLTAVLFPDLSRRFGPVPKPQPSVRQRPPRSGLQPSEHFCHGALGTPVGKPLRRENIG